jgi:hypothetical protein
VLLSIGLRTNTAGRFEMLGRMIACRLQERAFGGLDRESRSFLDSLARHGGSPRRQLKTGTVLVRDYQGQRHTVTVAPRFFALAPRNGTSAAGINKRSAPEHPASLPLQTASQA